MQPDEPQEPLLAEDDEEVPTELLEPDGADHGLAQQFRLCVLAGADAGLVHASQSPRVVIGTHQAAELILRDPTVSRFHCEITLSEGKILVRDLGSRNGTFLDGISIMAAHLKDGATLTLGRTQLRFELSGTQVKIPLSSRDRFGELVGRSRASRAVFAVLERAARSDVTVLIQGETGTGKDLAARAIHEESNRQNGPFVVIDCGSIPVGLMESELFGHERGAFTGADRVRAGAFEVASGGTLFLDEIGELSLDLQPKLLRALETHEFQRVGSTSRIATDVRVIAATNRNLKAEVNASRFRSDLYYRLAVMEVSLPPLRDRPEDLALLVNTLLARMAASDATIAALRRGRFLSDLARHSWPGNVRELRNYLERCLAMDAPLPISAEGDDQEPEQLAIDVEQPIGIARDRWVRSFERRYLQEMLRKHGGHVTAAARAAGVDRVHFYRLLSRCGLR